MTDKVTLTIEGPDVPKIKFDEQFWKEVGQAVEGGIITSILAGTRADGEGRLKVNAKSTRDRKKAKGRLPISLVDRLRRFVRGNQRSWKIKLIPFGGGVEIIPIAWLRDLVQWVQEKGYVGFLDVSPAAKKAINEATEKAINREFRKATRGISRRR